MSEDAALALTSAAFARVLFDDCFDFAEAAALPTGLTGGCDGSAAAAELAHPHPLGWPGLAPAGWTVFLLFERDVAVRAAVASAGHESFSGVAK